jgi:hypothetical protein
VIPSQITITPARLEALQNVVALGRFEARYSTTEHWYLHNVGYLRKAVHQFPDPKYGPQPTEVFVPTKAGRAALVKFAPSPKPAELVGPFPAEPAQPEYPSDVLAGDRMPGAWCPEAAPVRPVVARQFRAVADAYRIPLAASELAGLRAWDRGVCR